METRCGCSSPGILGCTCVLVGSDCIDVSGDGSTGDPFVLEPIISEDDGQLVSCGAEGLIAIASQATIARKVTLVPNVFSVPDTDETTIAFTTSLWASSNPLLWTLGDPTKLICPPGGAGKYLFIGIYQVGGAGEFVIRSCIRQNATNRRGERGVPGLTNLSQHLVVATIMDMDDGDYAELTAFQNSGSEQSAYNIAFVGCRLGRV